MKRNRKLYMGVVGVIIILGIFVILFWHRANAAETTGAILQEYMSCIEKGDFAKMYEFLDTKSRENITKKDFVTRNRKIYTGMDAHELKITVSARDGKGKNIRYHLRMQTIAGQVEFDNQAAFLKEDGQWKASWSDQWILPGLHSDDRVRVTVLESKRGNIYDRDGKLLAGEGTISVVGFVPKKMSADAKADIERVAVLLDLPAETIEKKLSASWVKADSFVPIQKRKKVVTLPVDLPPTAEERLQQQLLSIPGVMISDETARVYPLGEKASHLTGYVQNVSAEDLQNLQDDSYSQTSIIGKSGLEKIYEKRLHAADGYRISIIDLNGEERSVIATKSKLDGQDLHTTIDADLQARLYDQFRVDKSCSVAMNPTTGEVLALVSTPSFDSNDFVIGMSEKRWQALNEDEKKPLYNRYRATWAPGSSLKPIVAALGLTTGIIDPQENYGYEGLSWQKDASWGAYRVTTLHTYGTNVTLQNAIVYSDNIYFAKAALKFGKERFIAGMKTVGFGEKIPFEIGLHTSQYSNDDQINSEIQLADSGYGQGQVLCNPLHLASIYSAFSNGGNMIKPYLEITAEKRPAYWLKNVFSPESAAAVNEAMGQSVVQPEGTAHRAYSPQLPLAAKTGTAEIKATKEDTSGTELGWFCVFTTDTAAEDSLLLVSMVEDVKNIGGSTYVVKKDQAVLDQTFLAQ